MRVVMNMSTTQGTKTGVGHHTHEMLKALRATGEAEIITYPHTTLKKLHLKLGGGPKVVSIAPTAPGPRTGAETPATTAAPPQNVEVPRPLWLRGLRLPLRYAWQLTNETYTRAMFDYRFNDLYHEPNFVPLPGQIPTIVNIYDLSPVLYPQWHPANRIAWFEKHFVPHVRKFDHVLAITEFARREIIDTYGFAEDQVTRTYCGVSEHFKPLPEEQTAVKLRELGLPPQYLLHVGTVEPRKNLDMLLRVYCGLSDELRARCPLVLVGGWGWKMEETARFYEDVARHKNVILPGYLPDGALPTVYNGARALLFPTFYEGFGLPAAEMMACGGAVIASTAGAVAEVMGECGHQIDPRDTDGWRNALTRIITDDDWRKQLRHGATQQASQFTWERCARETLNAYKKTLARAGTKQVRYRTA